MNAAYATFCDRLLGHSLYLIPYRSAGEDHFGKRLMEIWDSVPADVGFKQIAPEMDVGFDLSQEYEAARQLFGAEE